MLTDNAIELAKGPNLGMISTKMPSGLIQTQPVWVDTDGENILVNTETGRQKVQNVEADPAATVTIMDPTNPWHWTEIRGRVTRIDGGAKARDHIDTLAKKYLGKDEYPNPIMTERIMLVIAPERVVDRPVAG